MKRDSATTNKIYFSWNAIPKSVKYKIFKWMDLSTNYKIDTTSSLKFLDSNLVDGATYSYRILSIRSDGEIGDTSNVFKFGIKPLQPLLLANFNTDKELTITWGSGKQYPKTIIYVKKVSDSLYTYADTTDKMTYTISNLIPLQSYNIYISVFNYNNDFANSNVITKTLRRALPRITHIQPIVLNKNIQDSILVNFGMNFPQSDTVNFNFEYSVNNEAWNLTNNIFFARKTNFSTVRRDTILDSLIWAYKKDLKNIESRNIRLKITPKLKNDSDAVFLVSTPFVIDLKPPIFSGIISNTSDTNKVTLVWNKTSDSLSSKIIYSVYHSLQSWNYSVKPDTIITDTSITINNLINFQKYYFHVVANDSMDNTDTNKVEVSAMPAGKVKIASIKEPQTIQKNSVKLLFKLNAMQQDTVNLKAEFSVDSIFWYPIRTENLFGNITNIVKFNFVDTLIWESNRDSILSIPIENYAVRLRIISTGKSGVGDSVTSNLMMIDNRAPRFEGISFLSQIANGDSIILQWKAAADIGIPIQYKIYQRTNGGNYDTSKIVAIVSETTAVISKILPFVKYSFVVHAIDNILNEDDNSKELNIRILNKAKLTQIITPSTVQKGVVSINYVLSASIPDTVSLNALYNVDASGWISIGRNNIIGNSTTITTFGSNDRLQWNSISDSILLSDAIEINHGSKLKISNNEYSNSGKNLFRLSGKPIESDNVRFALIPKGLGGIGDTLKSQAFSLDNRPPRFEGLQSLSSDSNGTSVTLQWIPAVDFTKKISYYIYRASESQKYNYSLPFDSIIAVSGSSNVIKTINTQIMPFNKYYFTVRAVDSIGNGESNTVEKYIVPVRRITGRIITQTGNTVRDSIKLSFLLSGSENDTAKISLSYSTNSGVSWNDCETISGNLLDITQLNNSELYISWHSLDDLPNVESHEMRIRIIVKGRFDTYGDTLNSKIFWLDTKPPVFSGLNQNIKGVFSNSNQLSWNSAKDTSTPITYLIKRDTVKENLLKKPYLYKTNNIGFNDSLILYGQTYYYMVQAIDSVGNVSMDSTVASFTVPILCNYDSDSSDIIDGADFSIFAAAWKNKDYRICDIGIINLKQYSISLQPIRNNILDLDDIVTFGFAWRWSLDKKLPIIFDLRYALNNLSKQENDLLKVEFDKPAVLKQNDSKIFDLKIDKYTNIQSLEILIKYNPKRLKIDSTWIAFHKDVMNIKGENIQQGYVAFVMSGLNNVLDSILQIGRQMSLKITALDKLEKDSVKILMTTFNKEGQQINTTHNVILFNYRSLIPDSYDLSQNYPNPFNPMTTIEFQLPIDTKISLKIYNILGQEIETLIDVEKKSGYYSVQWNAYKYSSGVYFYRLVSKDFVKVKKMLMLK